MYRKGLFVLLLGLAFSFQSCSSGDSGNDSGETARVEGVVTNENGFSKTSASVDGAVVVLARLEADGSLTELAIADTTEADGRFTLETDQQLQGEYVVVAKKDNSEWQAYLSSEIERGKTAKCQPHSKESTAESKVRQEQKAENMDEDARYQDNAMLINSELAANASADAQAVADLAASVNAYAEAREEVLTRSEFSHGRATLDAAADAHAEAQAQLEADLYAAYTGSANSESAVEMYHNAIVESYTSAGISADAYMKANAAAVENSVNAAAGLQQNAELELKRNGALLKSYANGAAVEAQLNTVGAGQSEINSAIQAEADLRADIEAAANVDEIEAAFEAYHDAVLEAVKITAGADATVITTIDASINGISGARATLDLALSTATTTEAVVDAYMEFYAAIKTLVEGSLNVAGNTEAEAYSNLMIAINLK